MGLAFNFIHIHIYIYPPDSQKCVGGALYATECKNKKILFFLITFKKYAAIEIGQIKGLR